MHAERLTTCDQKTGWDCEGSFPAWSSFALNTMHYGNTTATPVTDISRWLVHSEQLCWPSLERMHNTTASRTCDGILATQPKLSCVRLQTCKAPKAFIFRRLCLVRSNTVDGNGHRKVTVMPDTCYIAGLGGIVRVFDVSRCTTILSRQPAL
jgi:hypothetical protein